MSSVASNASIQCRMNRGEFDIDTWAEDDPPYMIETDDFLDIKKGQDGKYYIYNRADFGGTFTIHLAPYAPAVQWLINQANIRDNYLIQQRRAKIYECNITDVDRGVNFDMTGGVLLHAPKMMNPNNTYTARFVFERIVPNVDAGYFAGRFDPNGV